MKKGKVDYRLYLVTDSTAAILGSRDLGAVVREAVRGGATVVQYRDKTSDTRTLVDTAKALRAIAAEHGVPLLVNDRVDVALAAGCDGVHLGQDDLDIPTARRLLGPDAIIGATASTAAEALQACEAGADYLGLGTVFATATKKDTKHIIGPAGVRAILSALAAGSFAAVPAVCIGGINAGNAAQLLREAAGEDPDDRGRPAGIAVVSALMAASDPAAEAAALRALVAGHLSQRPLPPPPPLAPSSPAPGRVDTAAVVGVIAAVARAAPLSHNMTNLVVQNLAANVALAVGASPIMSSAGAEAADLARLGGALVVNMGTITAEMLQNYCVAVRAYNMAGRPVVLDPVGAGATQVRRDALKTLLAAGRFDVIKGNESEMQTVLTALAPTTPGPADDKQQKGVDGASLLDAAARADVVRRLASFTRPPFSSVAVLTGPVDFASDGRRTFAVRHGHPLMARVTGTGCCLGTVISATLAVHPDDPLTATVAALVLYGRAAELAAARPNVRGPGSFVPAFIDELARCRTLAADGDASWLDECRVETV